MASKVQADSAIRRLTIAITALDGKIAKLTARLTGDESLQSKGLIHEVSETRRDLHALSNRLEGAVKGISQTYLADFEGMKEIAGDHKGRLDAIERQNASQAGLLDDLRFVRTLTDKGWKIFGFFVVGGGLMPLITALWTKLISR